MSEIQNSEEMIGMKIDRNTEPFEFTVPQEIIDRVNARKNEQEQIQG